MTILNSQRKEEKLTVDDADHGGNVLSEIFSVLLSSVEGIDPNGDSVGVEVLIGSENSVHLEKNIKSFSLIDIYKKYLSVTVGRSLNCVQIGRGSVFFRDDVDGGEVLGETESHGLVGFLNFAMINELKKVAFVLCHRS